MSENQINLSFPLDDGFLRRECPLCQREFKILLQQNEIEDITQKGINSYLTDEENREAEIEEKDVSINDYVCPYCGQSNDINSWWTKEQLAYILIFLKNMISHQLMYPFKKEFSRKSSGIIKFEFKAQNNEQKEPWISPEMIDMETFDLPCCERKIKIEENWTGPIYCFFCGFPYENQIGKL